MNATATNIREGAGSRMIHKPGDRFFLYDAFVEKAWEKLMHSAGSALILSGVEGLLSQVFPFRKLGIFILKTIIPIRKEDYTN